MSTRPATIDDAEAIAIAHMQAWKVAYRGLISDDYLDAIRLDDRVARWRDNLTIETLSNGCPAPNDYVAELDGQVVGFANVGLWREAFDDSSLGELWAMYVHPDHWGTGAGYELMTATIAQFAADGVDTAYLWVLEDNAQARRFYERQGWQADDVTKDEEMGGDMITERRYSIALP